MTTEELLRLIERCRAGYAEVTIDTLAVEAGRPRRTIERAIETARLEGRPIITDGGVRLATTAAEAHQLARWLRARVQSQMDTIAAITSQARLMEAAEKSRPVDAVELWERLVDAA